MPQDSSATPLSLPTVTVIVRHSIDCKDKKRGPDWRKCDCRKSLVVYHDGRTSRISAKTRSWERAENFAREYRDQFDPEKQELRRLRAEESAKQVPLADAVHAYYADMIARLGDNGTVAMARSLFGHIDADTKAVDKNGHFFDWLDRQNPRPLYISEITPAHISSWRAGWRFGDLTASQRWSMVKGFFAFCEAQGWIDDSPTRKLKPPKVARGNRTAIFTDKQYDSILKAAARFEPSENVPLQTKRAWRERLHAFVELMRWTGMDLVDTVQWRTDSVDKDGVLRYRRQKTSILATIPLPEHLVQMIRNLPLERHSLGSAQPFRTKGIDIQSDCRKWARRLGDLFDAAGIGSVDREVGARKKPHAKMLRDTFAVSALRHGAKLHTVSKMLGHADTSMTEAHYLPWVQELEAAHIDDARRYLDAAKKKPARAGKVVPIKTA